MGSDPPGASPPRTSDARGRPRHAAGMKRLAHALCLAAGIALLALVLREVDLGAVASAAAAFGITAMLAVLALYAVEFLADTAGWHLAVTSVPFDAGWLRRLFVARLVGEAVNAATPLAGMGGEPVKAWLLKRRHAIEYGESAASLVIARTVNLLALLPFAGIGLMLAASDPRLPGAYAAAAGTGLAVLAVATLAFFAVQLFRTASSLGRFSGRDRPDRPRHPDGDSLSRIICDWVQGRPLSDMAADYFAGKSGHGDDAIGQADSVAAMTRCCRSIFGRLTQTASWGLAALQSLTIGDAFDSLPADEQRMLRNLPARVYYGVNSDEAVALRLLGVPRAAAAPMAQQLEVGAAEPLHEVRIRVRSAGVDTWKAALGSSGASHHRVWSIIEGEV